jgi:hypothetical protein
VSWRLRIVWNMLICVRGYSGGLIRRHQRHKAAMQIA